MSDVRVLSSLGLQLLGRRTRFWGIPPATARVHAFLLSSVQGADGETIADALAMDGGSVSAAA